MEQSSFTSTYNQLHVELCQLIPIVDKVHGMHHPEFHDVTRIWEVLKEDVKAKNLDKIADLFNQLNKVTDNYQIPTDVCDSFKLVYNDLQQLEIAYCQSSKMRADV
ncbi:iron-sulfur cluster repair di-iron protein, ric [Vagococcus vulneris]|uniref:Iron-sulfur cluster repair di-iron protein, ric n=1 Tax=Vagococcus vulneris TaxID=1977869 RepID=A0A429ZZD1_9ENTE|nr:iron-sulfur cluster repair di-iron protein, ric [Vagococcus vulneris]RST99377.1 hypothetical protein CBF37_05245 [Vagococcus vulneris]